MKVVVSILFLALASTVYGKDQSSAATGILKCNNSSRQGYTVQLYDRDFPDPDDKMGAAAASNKEGWFKVSGWVESVSQIKPFIEIKHTCTSKETICAWIQIPPEFITDGQEPKETYNAHEVELKNMESKSCHS